MSIYPKKTSTHHEGIDSEAKDVGVCQKEQIAMGAGDSMTLKDFMSAKLYMSRNVTVEIHICENFFVLKVSLLITFFVQTLTRKL